jgi:predicted ATPase
MARRYRHTSLPPPYLKHIWLDPEAEADWNAYPWCLPMFSKRAFELRFDKPVTIIAGENGVGKSTLLEAIGVLAGFDESGGGPGYRAVDNSQALESSGGALASKLKASWLPKIGQGWFFRAESFFSVARYLDEAAREWGSGPPPDFLSHSHGEGFIRFFEERCSKPGIFLFDEPESALSPNRQFDFLRLLHRIQQAGHAQVIMATHSPLLMALPDARLLGMGRHGLEPVELEETSHFRIQRQFALDPHGLVRDELEGWAGG